MAISRKSIKAEKTIQYAETIPELRKRNRLKKYKVGFAFCGGAVYGLAQVGVLRAFEKAGIKADCVAGTSSGSIVAAAYASGLSMDEIEKFGIHTGLNELYRFGMPRAGLVSSDALEDYISRHIGVTDFKKLRIPLAVVATDICSGEEVVFTQGPLGKAVRASCSIPGVYQPVDYSGRQLADGGLVENVPVEALKALGADVVIAVNVFGHPQIFPPATNLFQVLMRTWYFFVREQSSWRANADVVLEPDLRAYDQFDFSSAEEMLRVGEACAKTQIPKIRRVLEKHSLGNDEYF
jgi:NTE family protein